MQFRSIRLLLTSSIFAAAFATPSFAFDGQDLLNKINAAYKLQGLELVVKKVIVDGDEVTFTEAGLLQTETSEPLIMLGDIALEGVEPKDGGYAIKAINFEDLDVTEGTSRFVATDIAMENVIIPAYANAASVEGMMFYESASASDIEIYDGETRFIGIDNIFSTMNRDLTTGVIGARVELNEFSIDMSTIKDDTTADALNELQLEIISGSLSMGGIWNTKTGDLDVEGLNLSLDNIGTLTATFGISGYTMQFVEGLQEIAKEQAAAGADESGEAASMAGLAALGLAENLGIKNILIKFEDESITDRIIDFMAKSQGVSASDFKTMIKAIVPMYVSELGVPSLQQAIVKAVNIYLDDPQTISITAKPKSPVLTPELIGSALGDPKGLVDVLGVTVQAND